MTLSPRYLATRLAQAALTLAAAAFVAYLIIRSGRAGGLPEYGPAFNQGYVNYLGALASGDWGYSGAYHTSVRQAVTELLPWTMLVVASSTLLALCTGIVLGLLMAYYEGGTLDALLSWGVITLRAVPGFTLAFLTLMVLFYDLRIFPHSRGLWTIGTQPGLNVAFAVGVVEHVMILAAVMVFAHLSGALAMRASAVRVLGEDYVRVGRLRGLAPSRLAFHYVGRNAVLPAYTSLLVSFGELMGSTLVVEAIFAYPGLGYYLWQGAKAGDWTLLGAGFVVISSMVVAGVFLADLSYGYIDPRAASGGDDDREGAIAAVRGVVRGVRRRLRGTADRPRDIAALLDDEAGGVDAAAVTVSRRERLADALLLPARTVWDDTRGKVGIVLVSGFVLLAVVGPQVVAPPTWNEGGRLMQPFQTWEYPLGTNARGQDMVALLVHGAPPTFEMVLPGAALAAALASVVGLVAGYLGGWVDTALMSVADSVTALPGIPFAIALMPALGLSDPAVVGLLLAFTYWGGGAREIRSQVRSLRTATFVEAARAMGIPTRRVLAREVLPQVYPYVLAKFVDALRYVLVGVLTLYFLEAFRFSSFANKALDDMNWGIVLFRAETQGLALFNPAARHWLFLPLGLSVLFLFGVLLLSQGLDRVGNVRLRARHAERAPADPPED